MSGILFQLKTVTEDLNQMGLKWALVGALAVSVHTEPRTTRDIDVAIVLDGGLGQEELLNGLEKRGYGKGQVLMHMSPTHKMGFRVAIPAANYERVPLDLLFSSSGIEAEIVASASKVEIFPKLFLPVASRGHLLAMKVLSQNDTDRIRDQADLQKLFLHASKADLAAAHSALIMMAQRGFHRGKDLTKDFLHYQERFASRLI